MIKQWRYEPTKDYGGPKLDMEDLEIERFQLSEDSKKTMSSTNLLVIAKLKTPQKPT